MSWKKVKKTGITSNNFVNVLQTSKVPADYWVSLAPSKLPFCQVEYLWDIFSPEKPIRQEKFKTSFYFSIGTSVNEVVQKHLANIGILYGNWFCRSCEKYFKNKLGPVYCCRSLCVYDEYYFKLKHIKGKVDGILFFENEGWYILEIKTYNGKHLDKPKKPHLLQTNCYYFMIEEHLKENNLGFKLEDIKGVIHYYQHREDPTVHQIFKDDISIFNRKEYNKHINTYLKAKKMAKTGDLSNISRKCESLKDAMYNECPWASECFPHNGWKRKIQKLINEELKNKPSSCII